MSSVTVQQVKDLCAEIAEFKAIADELKLKTKKNNEELAKREGKLLAYLEESELEQFRTDHGLFSIRRRTSVKVPSDTDNRSEFFSYLQDNGIFENMITVHSQTLNAWYKQEAAAAEERGELVNIPGIAMPTTHEQIVFRRS